MEAGFEIKMFLYLMVAILSIQLICHFISRGKKSPLLYSYISFQALIFLWAFHDMLIEIYKVMSPGFVLQKAYFVVIYIKLEFFITCFSPYAWLVFCMNYAQCGRGRRKKVWLMLLFLPLLFFCLHAAGYFNPYTGRGIPMPMFFVYTLTCYSYLVAGTVLIIRHAVKQSGLFRKQAAILSVCVLFPLVSSIIQNYRMHVLHMPYEVFGIDLTLLSFTLTMLLIFIAAFKYRFLDPLPFAMRELFNSMDQPVVIISTGNTVLSCDHSFYRCFSGSLNVMPGDPAEKLISKLRDSIVRAEESKQMTEAMEAQRISCYKGEVTFGQPLGRSYSVSIRPVWINKTDYIGKVMVFSDITGLKRMNDELDKKNAELVAINEQLKNYTDVVEELTIERERNRIAQDIHDTVGQTMTVLNTLLHAGILSCEEDTAAAKEKLNSAAKVLREGIAELRRTVSGLDPRRLGALGLKNSLQALADSFTAAGLHVDLEMEDINALRESRYSRFIYRLCQEAMTNAVRHGRATRAVILIQLHAGSLRIHISDNGRGCQTISKGYGLTGIEQRVKEFNGKISFGNREETGFRIYIELPDQSA